MNTYQVKLTNTNQIICLSPATQEDVLLALTSKALTWGWQNYWSNLDANCQAIIKLESQNKIQGLINIALHPYPTSSKPEYLEIIALEAAQPPHRFVQPVGFYLIWYAARTSLDNDCTGNEAGSIVRLHSLKPAIGYYQNKVKMEFKGSVTLGPYEKGYTFRFSKEQAINFCNRIEQTYGIPEPI